MEQWALLRAVSAGPIRSNALSLPADYAAAWVGPAAGAADAICSLDAVPALRSETGAAEPLSFLLAPEEQVRIFR